MDLVNFHQFIMDLFRSFGIKGRYFTMLTSEDSLKAYERAFTHSSVSTDNYEVFEQQGDAVLQDVLIMYFYDRFPHLRATNAVDIIARLKIKYVAKTQLAENAKRLGFDKYIQTAPTMTLSYEKHLSIYEDVFEAFIGATAQILHKYHPGFYGPVCYHIIKKIYDGIEIDLSRKALYDSKTRLKEFFDCHKELGQTPIYSNSRKDAVFSSSISYKPRDGQVYFLASGSGHTSREAEQAAAEQALTILEAKYLNE